MIQGAERPDYVSLVPQAAVSPYSCDSSCCGGKAVTLGKSGKLVLEKTKFPSILMC